MHRRWTTAAAVIAMVWIADAASARDRSLPQADPPPLPYRLDGLSGTPAPPGEAEAPSPETAPGTQAAPQASATGVIRDGYYYPPPVTVTTVIEHRRR